MSIPLALLTGLGVFVAVMLLLGAMPRLISMIQDPPRMKHIRQHFESAGCSDIEIKPHSRYYGVRFTKDGAKHKAKCVVDMKSGKITWIGQAPAGL